MSAPHFLDPHTSSFPVVEQNEEPNLQLSLSVSPHHTSPSLSPPTFLNSTPHQPAGLPNAGDSFHHHHQVVDYISQSRLNDHKPPSSSSAIFEDKAPINDSNSQLHKKEDGDYYYQGSGEGSSAKWIPSNMRSMQNMINSNITSSLTDKPAVKCTIRFQYHSNNNDRNSSSSSSHNTNSNTNCTIRICSDCNTTTTPLWRSGPKGPKSLCNACGIRQRKARRAMAAAMASGTAVALETSASKSNKVHSKEIKKLSSGHVSKCKKLCKLPDPPLPQNTKLSFKNLALSLSKNPSVHHPMFPRDVEEAAILLMELSCSFIHA